MMLQYFSSYLHRLGFYLISSLFLQSFQKVLKKTFYLEKFFGFLFSQETIYLDTMTIPQVFIVALDSDAWWMLLWQSSQMASPNQKKCLVFLR